MRGPEPMMQPQPGPYYPPMRPMGPPLPMPGPYFLPDHRFAPPMMGPHMLPPPGPFFPHMGPMGPFIPPPGPRIMDMATSPIPQQYVRVLGGGVPTPMLCIKMGKGVHLV